MYQQQVWSIGKQTSKHSDFYAGRILTVCEYKRVDEEEGDGGKLEAN